MASLVFEGEFAELNTEQCQFIRDVLEKRGFTDNKVLFAPVGKVGENFASNVKRVTVEVENGENFNMVLKIAPVVDTIRTLMLTDIFFSNETVMYNEVLPKFRSLQIAADIPEEDRLKYAECYGCYSEKPNELILIEDLKPLDFIMLDRTQPLPNEAVRAILKNYAILHSLSYVLKNKEPDTYDTFKKHLFDAMTVVNERPENAIIAEKLESEIINMFDNQDYIKYIRGSLTGSMAINKRAMNRDKDSKYSVILQGDGWTNNIMFKMAGDVIKECIMIDYQLSREANPVCDILYTLFSCTDHATRAEHFYDWLDYYHLELDKSLGNFGLKASMAYPKDLLDADIRRYSKVYFATGISMLNVLVRKSEEAAEMKNAMDNDLKDIIDSVAMSTLSENTASLYKSRIEGIIDSCKLLGFL